MWLLFLFIQRNNIGSKIQIIRTKIEPLLISHIMKKEKGSQRKTSESLDKSVLITITR